MGKVDFRDNMKEYFRALGHIPIQVSNMEAMVLEAFWKKQAKEQRDELARLLHIKEDRPWVLDSIEKSLQDCEANETKWREYNNG